MYENTQPRGSAPPAALADVGDILGSGAVGEALVEAIRHGIGDWLEPWRVADRTWSAPATFAEREPTAREPTTSAAAFAIAQRIAIRLTAQEARKQENREAVAAEAAAAFRSARPARDPQGRSLPPLDAAWLDRFWRISEEVSDPDLRRLWGRLLAKRAAGAQGFGPVVLATLATLTLEDVLELGRLAAFMVSVRLPDRRRNWSLVTELPRYPFGAHKSPAVKVDNVAQYYEGLIYEAIKPIPDEIFGPLGIFVDPAWSRPQHTEPIDGTVVFAMADTTCRLSGFPDSVPAVAGTHEGRVMVGDGFQISAAGIDIISLMNVEADADFLNILRRAYNAMGFRFEAHKA